MHIEIYLQEIYDFLVIMMEDCGVSVSRRKLRSHVERQTLGAADWKIRDELVARRQLQSGIEDHAAFTSSSGRGLLKSRAETKILGKLICGRTQTKVLMGGRGARLRPVRELR